MYSGSVRILSVGVMLTLSWRDELCFFFSFVPSPSSFLLLAEAFTLILALNPMS